MRREEQKAMRKQEIIEKSLDLFISKGYASTKISDIAQAADMSVGLLFHYFDSKEALYESLIDIGVHGPKSIMNVPCKNSLDFFEQAASGILKIPEVSLFYVKIFVLMNQALCNSALPEHIKEKLSQIDNMRQSVPIIQKGQAEGTIKDGDPMALSVCFWGGIQGIMETLALNPDCPIPKADWLVDILRKN